MLITKAIKFIESLLSEATHLGIPIKPHWMIDHLCYRVQTLQEYDQTKIELERFGNLLAENEVNGRPIATYKLHEPIKVAGYWIPLIEIPAPKSGKITPSGFEHLEVVCDISFEDLEAHLKHLKPDISGLSKPINKEFELDLGRHAIKFHHMSLESVIRLETHKKAFSALNLSEAIVLLEKYSPLIAGTIPLDIATQKSDLDILLCSSNLSTAADDIRRSFGHHDQFRIAQKLVNGVPSLVASFVVSDFPFELFCQNQPTLKQTAYRHFLLEERLLSLGGTPLREKIILHRMNGEKTEPAFAKTLRLDGDPFQALLELQSASNDELQHLIETALCSSPTRLQ